MIIAAGTIVSSLQSDRLTRRLGAGEGDGFQRCCDSCCPVWIFFFKIVLDALSVGGSIWFGRGKC